MKEAISKIKAAFLRFFVSMMADYQKVMIVPQYSAELKLPSALDFFDLKKWISRFSLEKVEKGSKDFKVDWVEMFAQGQAFTQWLEQRLARAPVRFFDVLRILATVQLVRRAAGRQDGEVVPRQFGH